MSEREVKYEKMMKAVLGSYDSVAEKWISINKKEKQIQ